jgi:RimJ/RimL family protein N-acetyltransferase
VIRVNSVGLRARHELDVMILHAELYDDVLTRSRADSRPWVPVPASAVSSPYAVAAPAPDAAQFSVVELRTDELAGEAVLWGIDSHNRTAHVGLSLRPSFRGRGLSTDIVRALCVYGFDVRGLHRLQVDTLADNAAMIRAAERAGFTQDGRCREAAWIAGSFVDEVLLGLLESDYRANLAN